VCICRSKIQGTGEEVKLSIIAVIYNTKNSLLAFEAFHHGNGASFIGSSTNVDCMATAILLLEIAVRHTDIWRTVTVCIKPSLRVLECREFPTCMLSMHILLSRHSCNICTKDKSKHCKQYLQQTLSYRHVQQLS